MKRAYTVRLEVNSEMRPEEQAQISFDSAERLAYVNRG